VTQRMTFTREMIVAAAFALTRELGWRNVSARTIAQRLGSSTMPLYSSLKSMEELEKEVRGEAEELMHDYQRRSYSAETLLNSAIGYVAFARDEPNLFRFLYVDRPVVQGTEGGEKAADLESVGGVVDIADQAATAMRDPTVLKNWAFVHGLASLISGKVIDLQDERIQALLQEAGAAFYMYAETQAKNGKGALK
jgi:AcrR family transcriptional regulator